MSQDERFRPKRRKSDLVNPDAWLTLRPSGPRPRREGETSTRGREHGSRLQGIIGPVIEIEQFQAERNNLPPEPVDPGPGWNYSDDDQRAPGFDRDGNAY